MRARGYPCECAARTCGWGLRLSCPTTCIGRGWVLLRQRCFNTMEWVKTAWRSCISTLCTCCVPLPGTHSHVGDDQHQATQRLQAAIPGNPRSTRQACPENANFHACLPDTGWGKLWVWIMRLEQDMTRDADEQYNEEKWMQKMSCRALIDRRLEVYWCHHAWLLKPSGLGKKILSLLFGHTALHTCTPLHACAAMFGGSMMDSCRQRCAYLQLGWPCCVDHWSNCTVQEGTLTECVGEGLTTPPPPPGPAPLQRGGGGVTGQWPGHRFCRKD